MKLRWILVTILLALLSVQATPVATYVDQVKATMEPKEDEEQRLRKQIQEQAMQRYIAPIDARVDKIWKAIPGLNGREVDIERTFQATIKQNKGIVWKYREIRPNVSLADLGAVPIYRGNPNKKMAALMVNVAWGTEFVPKMLEILQREQVKATFFLDGSWLKKNPEVAKQIVSAGHEIGNHAFSHPLLSQVSTHRIEEEIRKTNDLIKEILHIDARWFAPPAGDFDQRVVEMAWKYKMHTVLWTVDTVDWRKDSTPGKIIDRIVKGITPGSLILSHPTDRTIQALPQMIRIIKGKGIQLGTVEEVLSSERMEKD